MGEFKSGYVSIVGETNAGKSTLLNGLMGEKLAIVSPKVQTTRNNIKGIYTDENKQIIFIDTPGIHKVNSKLSSVMIDSAITSIKDANIVLFVVAGNKKSLSVFDYNVLKKLKEAKEKNKNLHIIGIINKIDRIKKELNDELEFDYIIPVSAMLREGTLDILKRIEELLPKGPKYYSEDEYTDQTVREMCEEIIRGKALKLLNQEIPHGLYVEIESFKEAKTKKGEDIVNIETVIYTKKSTHKGIIVGKNGEMLKRIGSYARADIERMLEKKVNLQIWVKVRKNWLDNDLFLNRFKKK